MVKDHKEGYGSDGWIILPEDLQSAGIYYQRICKVQGFTDRSSQLVPTMSDFQEITRWNRQWKETVVCDG